MIGFLQDSYELETYFKKLVKHTPKDTLVISFSCDFESENCIYINTCFDSAVLIKIFDEIKNYGLPVTVFMPKCTHDTIFQIIYLSDSENTTVYAEKCTPVILNPSLLQTFSKIFGIKIIDTVKKDIRDITGS